MNPNEQMELKKKEPLIQFCNEQVLQNTGMEEEKNVQKVEGMLQLMNFIKQ